MALICLTVCLRVLRLETKPGTFLIRSSSILSSNEVQHSDGALRDGREGEAGEEENQSEAGKPQLEKEAKNGKEAPALPTYKVEEEDDWNGKCPYEKSKLEKYKCWLPKYMTQKGGHFDQYLSKKADEDKVIFLISVDQGYVDMALNLYETSFDKFNILNFLYICSDNVAALALNRYGLECFLFVQKGKNEKAADFMSQEFVRKTHVKTKIILGALSLGYTVFITGNFNLLDLKMIHNITTPREL